jgi:hypothetical protein
LNFEPFVAQCARNRVGNEVRAFFILGVRHLEVLGRGLAAEGFFDFELALQLAVILLSLNLIADPSRLAEFVLFKKFFALLLIHKLKVIGRFNQADVERILDLARLH